MLQYYFSLRQFQLIKWSFFEHSTTRNGPYVHLRLDSILELCRTFPIAFNMFKGIKLSLLLFKIEYAFIFHYISASV